MFNTDTTVPEWEKSPENHTENQENAELSQRAQAWAEAFPDDSAENPWLTANMEETPNDTPAETPFEDPDARPMGPTPNPSQEAEAPNQLNNPDNIVAGQMLQVWNGGDGGQSLENAYDDLRGSFTAENIKTSADMVEPVVADTIRENKSKDPESETELTIDNNLDPEEQSVTRQQQVQADLYNLTASAGATALGAQASAETAMNSLQHDNESTDADAAQRDLEEAQRALEDIQSELPTITSQLERDPLALKTAENTINDAQNMVAEAQESLQAAQDAANERQDFIEDNQEAIDDLKEQGVQMEEINQAIDETGSIEQLQNENPPEDEEDEAPRPSIFG